MLLSHSEYEYSKKAAEDLIRRKVAIDALTRGLCEAEEIHLVGKIAEQTGYSIELSMEDAVALCDKYMNDIPALKDPLPNMMDLVFDIEQKGKYTIDWTNPMAQSMFKSKP
jgi:CHAD domain-containing protein